MGFDLGYATLVMLHKMTICLSNLRLSKFRTSSQKHRQANRYIHSKASSVLPLWQVLCCLCGKFYAAFVASSMLPLWQVLCCLCGSFVLKLSDIFKKCKGIPLDAHHTSLCQLRP